MLRRLRWCVLLAVALVAVVLAGCGDPSRPVVTPAHPMVAQPDQLKVFGGAGGSVHPPGWGRAASDVAGTIQPHSISGGTFEMYDTVTLDTVPSNPFALAGYTAGNWPTYGPLRAAYPSAHTISIAIQAYFYADCLDVEPGDASPDQVVGWIIADRAHGFAKPCVYSSYFEFVDQIRPLIAAAGISRSSIFEWDANYDYYPHIDASFDATQWTDVAFGRNLDESTVTAAFLSIAQPPYSTASPPDSYRILDKHVYDLPYGQKASEYKTVKAYEQNNCQRQPSGWHRTVCRTSGWHLQLLRDRLIFVERHRLVCDSARAWGLRCYWVTLKHPDKRFLRPQRLHRLQFDITH